MSSVRETNRDIWQKVIRAWAEGDIGTLTRYLSPEIEIIEPDSLPYRGVFRGPEGYAELYRQIAATWDEMEIERGQVIGGDDEDALVIEYFMTARARSTGKFVTREPSLALWKFHDGKVVSMTPFNFDTARIQAALSDD